MSPVSPCGGRRLWGTGRAEVNSGKRWSKWHFITLTGGDLVSTLLLTGRQDSLEPDLGVLLWLEPEENCEIGLEREEFYLRPESAGTLAAQFSEEACWLITRTAGGSSLSWAAWLLHILWNLGGGEISSRRGRGSCSSQTWGGKFSDWHWEQHDRTVGWGVSWLAGVQQRHLPTAGWLVCWNSRLVLISEETLGKEEGSPWRRGFDLGLVCKWFLIPSHMLTSSSFWFVLIFHHFICFIFTSKKLSLFISFVLHPIIQSCSLNYSKQQSNVRTGPPGEERGYFLRGWNLREEREAQKNSQGARPDRSTVHWSVPQATCFLPKSFRPDPWYLEISHFFLLESFS